MLRQEQSKHSSKFSLAVESSAAGWEVRLRLDNVHNELSGQGGDRKQQKPWGRNPGFHLLGLISERWFEEYHPFCCQHSGREDVFLGHLYFHQ